MLNYSSTWDAVWGPYWSSGSSDIIDSYGTWRSTNGSLIEDDTTDNGAAYILENCLYAGLSRAESREDLGLVDATFQSGQSGQGINSLCKMPVGGEGAWLGTYQYIYGVDDDSEGTELGTYGIDPLAFWPASGMGFIGTWHALSGPYAGSTGSNIYMVTTSTAGNKVLVGYYCSVNATTLERLDCFNELYDAQEEDALGCPAAYKRDGTLTALRKFAGAESCDDDNAANGVAVGLAIAFGVLSFVLLLVVAILIKASSKGAAVASSQAK